MRPTAGRRPVARPLRRRHVPVRGVRLRRRAGAAVARTTSTRTDDVVSLLTIPIVPSLVYAALLVVMAVALRRRLRAAWWVLVIWWLVLPEIGRIVAIAEGERVVLDAVGFVLVAARHRARGPGAPPVRRPAGARAASGPRSPCSCVGGAVVLLGGAALVSGFGTVPGLRLVGGVRVRRDARRPRPGRRRHRPSHAPLWVPARHRPGRRRRRRRRRHAAVPGARATPARLDAADEAQVRTLLRDFGDHDSLGYFATRRDKSVVWDTGDAGHGTRRGLLPGRRLGEPGQRQPGRRPAALAGRDRRVARQARQQRLVARGDGRRATRAPRRTPRPGSRMLDIGDEAILDMRTFSLTGPGMKAVRQSVTRLQRRGYTTRVLRHASLTDADFARSERRPPAQWRGDGGDERGFSMALGRLGDPLDGDCVLVAGPTTRDGQLRGFLSFVPWGRTGLSLDLMRRDPTADNGLVELMVACLAERAATFGDRPGLAELRDVPRGVRARRRDRRRPDRPAVAAVACCWPAATGSWSRSTARTRSTSPEWQPRFICFEYTSDLPRVGTAAGSAEGFLTAPSISLLRRTGRGASDALDTGGAEYAAAVLAQIPPAPDAVAEALSTDAPARAAARTPGQARPAARARASTPTRSTYPRTHTLAQVARRGRRRCRPTPRPGVRVSVAGRVLLKRDMGELGFAHAARRQRRPAGHGRRGRRGRRRSSTFWEHDVDLGDHVGVTGEVVTTHRGELSVARRVASRSPASRCARCPTSTRASPTPRRASATATST